MKPTEQSGPGVALDVEDATRHADPSLVSDAPLNDHRSLAQAGPQSIHQLEPSAESEGFSRLPGEVEQVAQWLSAIVLKVDRPSGKIARGQSRPAWRQELRKVGSLTQWCPEPGFQSAHPAISDTICRR